MTRQTTPTADGIRQEMLDEGRGLVDAAREDGLTLRLLGGLAVREHCRTAELCERDYSDLDMVARTRDAGRLPAVLARFGYAENREVSLGTDYEQMQFVRPCAHVAATGGGTVHGDDHVDVFLDGVHMDHDIALARRLEIEPYTVSLSDLVLSKLQIFQLNEKDLRDLVTLLGDFEAGDEDVPGLINAVYVGRLCGDDWGLFYDVGRNLERLGGSAMEYDLDDAQTARLHRGVARLTGAIDGAPKSLRWRVRARIGTRKSWHARLDDQD